MAKSANSWELYCGPLSLMTSGIPWRAKIDFRIEMIALGVVDLLRGIEKSSLRLRCAPLHSERKGWSPIFATDRQVNL